ncbi:MAG: hypothetical protein WGN25_12305 [Candidatus Electrothrix sp. GW3-4]|uniref:hypothetical protein n=1 Tax=Candidatus Electrothrix sp. GW3-4 TaxID=3126740 RepID=UPI0030D0B47F
MDNNSIIQYLIGIALTLYPTWRIVKRTGLNPNWSALLLIPGLGALIVTCMLALSEWPLNDRRG